MAYVLNTRGIKPTKMSIASAIEFSLDGSDYDRGELEAIKATVDNTAQLLGKLGSNLYHRGLVSDGEIGDMLSYGLRLIP